MKDGGSLLALVLIVAVAMVVAKLAYREGYKRGQADFLRTRPPTEDERNRMLMRSTLPLWRRVGGWAAFAASGLPFWWLLSLAISNGSAWAFVAAVLTSFVFIGIGGWLSDWFWRPYRKAQEEQRRADAEKKRHSS